jgi:hypothetical protein
MNYSKYFLISFLPLLFGCQSDNSSYEVLTKSKIIKKEYCEVPVDYPQIKWKFDNKNHGKINEMLEKLPDHEYYAKNCSSSNPQVAKGRFVVLLKTDSILCVEYQTDIKYKKEHRMVFHSLVINPNKDASVGFGSIGVEPKDLIPNFDRSKILPYIEKYNLDNKDNINLLAYQKGSNYAITWGITKSHLIIYPGGEGEWFGYDKIKIPLSEFD